MNKKVIRTPFSDTVNKMSTEGLIVDLATPRCNRAKLDTGTFCNYDCEFCYYRDKLDIKTSFEIVKERADYLLAYGITQVDLSGGESSVSSDWFNILDYCNERFDHVSCLTHGGKFANKEFLEESKARGLKEILFSLHGATDETHDSITNRKGSFKRILQAIKNAQELEMIVRINCTVYYKNYTQLDNIYAELINNINPFEVNFITLNYWEGADIEKTNVSYSDMTNGIKQCIDILNKDMIINVRYVPYCYMNGYEKYVCNQYQHIYDLYDWNKEVYLDESLPRIDISKTYTNEEKLDLAYKQCASLRVRYYYKDVKCVSCKYFYICDGVEKELPNTTMTPIEGEKIKEVTFFRKEHFK
jgi:MoaA/NifB/PqqE/SkfB family radical SAM enzyme